jgi:Tol biopolymer transport system component/predicted Ser/Thr protein kinase
MSDRWESVKRLFDDALGRAPEERAAFLDGACDATGLRREVEALLEADARAGDFLASPALVTGVSMSSEAATLCLSRVCARCGARYGSECALCPVDGTALMEDPEALVNTTLDGTYDVVRLLGTGGMGDVYLARDTKLRRPVALKLLPASVSQDRDRLRRFEREARAAAKLSHPNVCMVYELGATDEGRHFIAMEYVEGRTLRSRLKEGALPLAEALDVARQVAHALAAAHEAGVVHRDIKPENVMLRPDGYVKVLDFGIAKLTQLEVERAAADAGAAATGGRQPITRGVIGTVGYMSPEQARGRRVDARSDVFSLGAMLYELLTGERAFARDTAVAALQATIREEPPRLEALAAAVPAGVAEVVRRCLEKEPEQRYASGATLAATLDELAESFRSSSALRAVAQGNGLRRRWWLALASAALLAGGGAWWRLASPPDDTGSRLASQAPLAPRKVTRLTSVQWASVPKFSPDGKQLTYSAINSAAPGVDVYIKMLDDASERRLTSDPGSDLSPSWSPDGQSLAFIRQSESERAIYIVPVLGGPERKLLTTNRRSTAAEVIDWSPTGELIAYTDCDEPDRPLRIYLASVETGESRQLTFPPGRYHRGWGDWSAAFSPDGQSLAFIRSLHPAVAEVYVVPVAGGEACRLTFDNQHVLGLTWTPDGRSIVFASARVGATTLWRIAAEGGEPEPVEAGGSPGFFPTISRDGRRLAYVSANAASSMWLVDLPEGHGRPGTPVQLFTSAAVDGSMRFSPDGTRIAFASNRSGAHRLWVCDSDGSNPLQVRGLDYAVNSPPSWSPDGRYLAFDAVPEGNSDVYVVGADGGPPRRLTDHPGGDQVPIWSRDGRWIYFVSDRSGEMQLWKVSSDGGEAVQVTRDGGSPAFESSDGRYLYYQKGPGVDGLWRMAVDGGEEELVFDGLPSGRWDRPARGGWDTWTLADDGVYFGDSTEDGSVIEFYSFATRKVTRIATTEGSDSITISPDGRRLLYANLDRLEYNIVLVENVRW